MTSIGYPDAIVSKVPPPLSPYISAGQWATIVDHFHQIDRDALFYACGVEWGICLICFGFWCIFCGHPCIKDMFLENETSRYCKNLNSAYFSGDQIFDSRSNGEIVVYYDRLQNIVVLPQVVGIIATQYQPQTQPSSTTQYMPLKQQTPDAYGSDNVTSPTVVPPTKQIGQVTVTAEMKPGSTITTQAPNGAMVSMVVPENATTGTVLQYEY